MMVSEQVSPFADLCPILEEPQNDRILYHETKHLMSDFNILCERVSSEVIVRPVT